MEFKLWLEFEEIEPDNWDFKNEFANIRVSFKDEKAYGINIWTYDFLKTAVQHDLENGDNLNGLYQIPPDLLVKELTHDCIEKTIKDLLIFGDLDDVLNSSIIIN